MSTEQLGGGNMQMNTSLFMNVLQQCCNEDWKWTKDEDEESSDQENRPKMKILRNFEKSLKTFKDMNFFEDLQR